MSLLASRLHRAATALSVALLSLTGPGLATSAHAEGINGFLEYGYSYSTSDVTDATQSPRETTGDSFRQRYFLNIERTLYPNLRFTGGGLFEQTMSTTKTDDLETDSKTTRFAPRADLTLSNIFYNAGIGYNRRTDSTKIDGNSSPDRIVETLIGRLSLKPEGLPPVNFFYTRTNNFDENRESRDTTTDSYSLSSTYRPLKDLEIGYLGQYTKQTDNLNDRESTSTLHNGRVAYSRQFLEGRASLTGTYNISMQQTENVRFISSPLPATAAFSENVSAPLIPDTTDLNFTLPAGILTNGSGIEPVSPYLIGKTPDSIQTLSTNYYHFGLDLQVAAPTNTLFVTINPSVELSAAQMMSVSSQFTWRVFSSTNNNDDWMEIPLLSAQFNTTGSFGTTDNSYELTFNDTSARYFKVVIQPKLITSPVDYSGPIDVHVTELRSSLRIAESTQSTSTESTSHLLNLGGRVRIYDPYDVNYEFFYTYNKSDTDFFSSSRYTISNALRAQHRFSPIITGSARVAREDSSDDQEDRTAYIYSASLQATPLPLLSHTLVYSGRTESADSGSSSSNSLYLNNSASPYRGIDLSLSAGYSTSTTEDGQKNDSLTMGLGTSLTPNPKLSINLNYAVSNNKYSGGSSAPPTTTSHRGDLSVSYNPVRSIYLFGSLGIFAETDRDTTRTHNFGGSWGILRDGSLQLNFSYNENFNQANNQKERTIVPSLRWNIRPGSHFDVSYFISRNTSDIQEADFTSLSALLRIGF
jgi:hypothetical protein